VNLQTSYMHPPFGFALFYLRGIAPREVKSNDIYLGAIPWVVLQLIMVALVIAFPDVITAFLSTEPVVDLDKVNIELEAPAADTTSDDDLQKQFERSSQGGANK